MSLSPKNIAIVATISTLVATCIVWASNNVGAVEDRIG